MPWLDGSGPNAALSCVISPLLVRVCGAGTEQTAEFWRQSRGCPGVSPACPSVRPSPSRYFVGGGGVRAQKLRRYLRCRALCSFFGARAWRRDAGRSGHKRALSFTVATHIVGLFCRSYQLVSLRVAARVPRRNARSTRLLTFLLFFFRCEQGLLGEPFNVSVKSPCCLGAT